MKKKGHSTAACTLPGLVVCAGLAGIDVDQIMTGWEGT